MISEQAEVCPLSIHATALPELQIRIEADATIGYVSIHNHIPVVRSLTITHHGSTALTAIEVIINCMPRFADGVTLKFERLLPGEIRRIAPIDLQPNHVYLTGLNESERALINVVVMANDSIPLAEMSHPIEVLAYDQWAGTQSLPELLAAFCMPNASVIDQLIGRASVLLHRTNPDASMNGYQSKNREAVWKQVSAIYSVLLADNLQYSSPPASFGSDGQKIRTPQRILNGRIATCLDLAMLFASCLEGSGLHPLILVKEGHAWIGVWLIESSFLSTLVDDVQAVRKRVKSGELLVFETTGITNAQKQSLRWACTTGEAHLNEESGFQYVIDIKRAREAHITPLPSYTPAAVSAPTTSTFAPAIEDMPALPPLDSTGMLETEWMPNTPEGRLANWKGKLLDLTLRNRLLNFKPVKTSLRIMCTDLAVLEEKLTNGGDFKIRTLPPLMTGADNRAASVYVAKTGISPIDALVAPALARCELMVDVPEEALDTRLLGIFRAAGTGLEENGANTLFMVFGLLQWQENEDAEAQYFAPILLVPVSLTRQSVRNGFRLTRHDDDALVNPTLIQKLSQDYGLKIPIPDDMNIQTILQIFRLKIAEIKGWEVKEQVHLGIFSFTKFLMWKDLQDRYQQLQTSDVIAHLLNNPDKTYSNSDLGFEPHTLDDTHRPQDVFAPLLSDSSQLRAICVASEGKNLVIEGPPGTGKSQTITNLIAHLLATGKRVLFVSEKRAALEVVHSRLYALGLEAFCLELHSSKAKKTDVLKQLEISLNKAGLRTVDDWEREAERLSTLRQELNGLVKILHHVYPNGLTIYDAMGICVQYHATEPASMNWPHALIHSQSDLDALRETTRQMATLASELSTLYAHPLSHINKTDWTPTWQQDFFKAVSDLTCAANNLSESATPFCTLLHLPGNGFSLAEWETLDQLADVLIRTPQVSKTLVQAVQDEVSRNKISCLRSHGVTRQIMWESLGGLYRAEVTTLKAEELQLQWAHAQALWWPRSWLAKRSLMKSLQLFRCDAKPLRHTEIAEFLTSLAVLNAEDHVLTTMATEALVLLNEDVTSHTTNWHDVESVENWGNELSRTLAQLVGGNPEKACELRATMQVYITKNHPLLKADGCVGAQWLRYRDAFHTFIAQLLHVTNLGMCANTIGQDRLLPGFLPRLFSILQGWIIASRQMKSWTNWQRIRATAIGQGLQGLVATLEHDGVALVDIVDFFEYSYQHWWLKKAMDREPVLCAFSGADHERKIAEFRQADERFQELTKHYIIAQLSAQIPAHLGIEPGADSELGKLRRELQRQRGHMPIRKLVQSLPTLLPKLKPCLLMSPLSAAQYLNAMHSPFDVVIFDEASQIPVWDAIGVIARGKQLICVGDPKQLPPSNFFNRTDDTDETGGDYEDPDLASILDECLAIGMPKLQLLWHYRSRHESLITFSNVTYYDNRLITFPSPVANDRGVRFELVQGVYDRGGSRTNRAEADAIVQAIEQHYLDETQCTFSLGVVTFNQAQQSLIERLLDERRRALPALDQVIAQLEHEPLFIKNLENVQGDERDIIYFSITYGPDAAGKINLNFGPLNLDGGHRRLNVAISRAKQGVVVFSTLKPEHIDLSRVRAKGVIDLKHYLEFAIHGPKAITEQIIPTGHEPDSPFERAVIAALREKGWTVHPQVGVSGYRIDIGVVDPRAEGRYLLGVECDGRTYHSGATARDRDRLRQYVLEGLGWTIFRIWSTDWFDNPQGALHKLLSRLEQLVSEEPQACEESQSLKQAAIAAAPEECESLPVMYTPVLMRYPITQLAMGTPEHFYEASSDSALRTQLLQVINTEGPVADFIVYRRVARTWGLLKTGSRIEARLKMLMPTRVSRTRDNADIEFYWSETEDPKTWKSFRVPGEGVESKRGIKEICLEELANIARFLLSEHGNTSDEDLARSMCRLLGIGRTSIEAEKRIGKAVSRLKDT